MKKHTMISSTQFFVLFCFCFVSPSIVFLPALTAKQASNAAWIVPILSAVVFVVLFYLLSRIFRARGNGLAQKTDNILGRTLGRIVRVAIAVWTMVLSAFFLRHFAERVLLVYLSDASILFIVVSLAIVILIALSGGLLSFGRLCEILFYLFGVLFLALTIASMLDGMDIHNILPLSLDQSSGIFYSILFMLLPFHILVCMMFFGENVNFYHTKILKQGIKASIVVSLTATIIVLLTIGRLGEFGTRYLQLPYFSTTRQIDFLGPLKNVGAVVFSLWILADFALVSTTTFVTVNTIHSLTKQKYYKALLSLSIIAIACIAMFAWTDMSQLDLFLQRIVIPVSAIIALGVPILLYAVGLIRGKMRIERSASVVDSTIELNATTGD